MARPALIDAITAVAEPVVTSLGLEIWGIDILQSGRAVVRIFVDVPLEKQQENTSAQGLSEGEEGFPLSATIDQCEEISRHVGLTLEVEDVIPTAYVLEVSSPGLTRLIFKLEQLQRFVGEFIEASLIDPLPELGTRKRFKGVLRSVQSDSFTLELCDLTPEGVLIPLEQEVCLPWVQCRKVSKVHIFAQPAKPGKAPKQPKSEKKAAKKEQ